ncbi:restriction endonuclease subunit S [Streptomyces sp. NPDC097619]|uniref:restriction endonuclease subunit S n=1 Tax=Streptomyces sp. NPDC097619 TaxID=3157228 RepID=UPI003328F3A6
MAERTVSLAELVDENQIEVGAGRPRSVNQELPILRVADVLDGKIGSPDFSSSLESHSRDHGPKVSRPGDIVLTVKGTVGRVALIPSEAPRYAYSPQLCYFRPHADGPLMSRYLYYWFRSADFWIQANALKGQTDMADFISLGDILSLKLRVPSLAQQEGVVGVLGSLDDKIAANERIARTAHQLMESKYVNALNAGSTQQELGKLAEFHNRKRVPLSSRQRAEIPGPYPYYGAAGVVDYVRDFLFSGPHLLVGEDGTVITEERKPVTQYVWGDFWVNNHAHVLTGRSISTELLAVALQLTDVSALVSGAVQPKLNMRNLSKLEVPLPTEVENGLDRAISDLMALVRGRNDENRTLAALRDTLLPQLMSGKLRVRDAERIVEAVV